MKEENLLHFIGWLAYSKSMIVALICSADLFSLAMKGSVALHHRKRWFVARRDDNTGVEDGDLSLRR